MRTVLYHPLPPELVYYHRSAENYFYITPQVDYFPVTASWVLLGLIGLVFIGV